VSQDVRTCEQLAGQASCRQAAKTAAASFGVKGRTVEDDPLLHGIAALCWLNSYARDLV
jgi:hypothetical protein